MANRYFMLEQFSKDPRAQLLYKCRKRNQQIMLRGDVRQVQTVALVRLLKKARFDPLVAGPGEHVGVEAGPGFIEWGGPETPSLLWIPRNNTKINATVKSNDDMTIVFEVAAQRIISIIDEVQILGNELRAEPILDYNRQLVRAGDKALLVVVKLDSIDEKGAHYRVGCALEK